MPLRANWLLIISAYFPMDQWYKMDVFFFVTTIAMVVITIVSAIAAVYVIAILKDIKYISQKAKNGTDQLAEDFEELRTNVREEGIKLKNLGNFFAHIYKRNKK